MLLCSNPDYWRHLGIAAVLSESGIVVADERVEVVLLSCTVITQRGGSEIARARSRYGAEVARAGRG